jgi:PleD family two-component response regulator
MSLDSLIDLADKALYRQKRRKKVRDKIAST